MAWIGGLKVFQYEADGIVPYVTNSPFMSFFYKNTGKRNQGPHPKQKTLLHEEELGATPQAENFVARDGKKADSQQYLRFPIIFPGSKLVVEAAWVWKK